MHYLIFLLLLFSACSTPQSSSQTLRIAFHSFPSTMDPRKASDFVSSTLICLLYDGLTRCLPDGSVEPAIAERWEISEDETVYRFYLRSALWSDGKAVSAYDFEKSWKDVVDPDFPSPSAYLFYPIKHAEKIAKKELLISDLAVRALSANVLEVELEKPCPYFLSLTAFPSFLPVPFHTSDIDLAPIVNGPFCVKKSTLHAGVYLTQNPSFWNRGCIHFDAIDIQVISDEMAALHLFLQKKLDWIGGALSPLPLDASEFLQKHTELQFSPMAATTFCSFNLERFPLNHPKFRKALSLAIPREEIVRYVTQMGEISANRCVPPALFQGENKEFYPSFDRLQAKLLFEEFLQDLRGEKIPHITLSFRTSAVDKKIAQILQKSWKDILGVEVDLREMDFKGHKDLLHKRRYEIALSYWIAQFHDPMNILERFKDFQNFKNYPGWKSAEYQEYLEKASGEKDAKKRFFWLEKAEALLAQEMPIAPIYHWSSPSLCQPRLKNLETTPNGGVLFERAFFDWSLENQ